MPVRALRRARAPASLPRSRHIRRRSSSSQASLGQSKTIVSQSRPLFNRTPPGAGLAGFLIGTAGMFAVMYSTQAILPVLSRDLHVTPARAGLTVSVVVIALAAGAGVWGAISGRIGRKRSFVLA